MQFFFVPLKLSYYIRNIHVNIRGTSVKSTLIGILIPRKGVGGKEKEHLIINIISNSTDTLYLTSSTHCHIAITDDYNCLLCFYFENALNTYSFSMKTNENGP